MSKKPRYTSQHKEDQWLDRNWGALGLPDIGFFVEVGAADGVALSNTYWLEHTRGWRGLLIEPDPRYTITDRPASLIERCAIGPSGIVSFGLTRDPYLSGVLRGTNPDHRISATRRISVQSVPLSELLQKHSIKRVDLISIDTEGTDLEAWRTLDLRIWRPTIVIIELRTWGLPNRAKQTITAMVSDGYELLVRTRYNGIFRSL